MTKDRGDNGGGSSEKTLRGRRNMRDVVLIWEISWAKRKN